MDAPEFQTDAEVYMVKNQGERLEGYIRPVGGIGPNDKTFEFQFPDIPGTALLLRHCTLFCQGRILTKDNAAPASADNFSVVNSLGTMMQENTEVFINNFLIAVPSNVNNGLKFDFERDLSYDANAAKTHLATSLYIKDKAGNFDSMGSGSANDGYKDRAKLVKGGKPFHMVSPIVSDFFRANEHFRSGNTLSLKIHRASDEMLILCSDSDKTKGFKFVIDDLAINFFRTRLLESPQRSLGGMERYQIVHTTMQKFPLTKKQTEHKIIHSSGKFPRQIVFATVETAAIEGKYSLNPLNKQHFGLNQVYLKINSKIHPPDPYTPDFEKNLCTREYYSLYQQTGLAGQNKSNLIEPADFAAGGYVYIAFDLSNDMCNSLHIHSKPEGEIVLHLGWKETLDKEITVLVYCAFDALLVKNPETSAFDLHII